MTDTTTVTSGGKLCEECSAPLGPEDDKRYKTCSECRGVEKEGEKVHDLHVSDEALFKREDAPELEAGVFPLQIDIEEQAPPPPEERDYYWCGATHDCPWHYVTLGGISFPKYKGEVRFDHEGQGRFQDNTALGIVNRLTDEQVAVVLQHAANKIVRRYREEKIVTIGADGQPRERINFSGDRMNLDQKNYRPHEGDVPLGRFVYMIKVRSKNDRPFDSPPTLVPR